MSVNVQPGTYRVILLHRDNVGKASFHFKAGMKAGGAAGPGGMGSMRPNNLAAMAMRGAGASSPKQMSP